VLQDNLVAVYGTLKKGYSNNSMLSGSRYVGKGTTLDKYPLEVSGLPYLHDVKGSGYNVDVHIYKVSDNVLKNLDSLEGHPYHYKRKEIIAHIQLLFCYTINSHWCIYLILLKNVNHSNFRICNEFTSVITFEKIK